MGSDLTSLTTRSRSGWPGSSKTGARSAYPFLSFFRPSRFLHLDVMRTPIVWTRMVPACVQKPRQTHSSCASTPASCGTTMESEATSWCVQYLQRVLSLTRADSPLPMTSPARTSTSSFPLIYCIKSLRGHSRITLSRGLTSISISSMARKEPWQ